MQRFLVRRFIIVIITLFAVSVIIFIMARAGGDPRSMLLDDYATEEQWDDLGKALGIDRPYYQQYAIFIADVFRGDFGQSIKERRPVIKVISERVWATLQLGLAAFAFSVVIGIPLGGAFLGAAGRDAGYDGEGGGAYRAVGAVVLAGDNVHILVCGQAGVGAAIGTAGMEQHYPADGDAGVGVYRRQSAADAVGDAGCAGFGVR